MAVADSSLSPREIFQQRIPLDDEIWMMSTVSREEIDEGRSTESGKCLDFGRVTSGRQNGGGVGGLSGGLLSVLASQRADLKKTRMLISDGLMNGRLLFQH